MVQNGLKVPVATVSNAHKGIKLDMSFATRLAPGARAFKRSAMEAPYMELQMSVWASDEPTLGHILSSRVSFNYWNFFKLVNCLSG